MRSRRLTLILSCWPHVLSRFPAKPLPERLRPRSLQESLIKALIIAGLLLTWLAPAARASGIFWGASTAIASANLDGTGVNNSFIAGANSPFDVVVDGAFIYWTNLNGGTIGRANLDGTGVNQSFITGASSPVGLAVDATHIYWTNGASSGPSIGRANLDGTGVNQTFIPGVSAPGLAVDGSYLFFSTNPGPGLGPPSIGRANLDGTGVNPSFITPSTALSDLFGLAVDGTHIYWAHLGSNTIGRANLDGTGVNDSFITGANLPAGVAVDGTFIYWANSGTSSTLQSIGRANLDGTGVNQSFITPGYGPIGIAVSPVPEPATGLLVMAGVLGLAVTRCRARVSA